MKDGTVRLQAGSCLAAVDAGAGGRLTSLTVDGRELLVQHGVDVFHWGSFPMAPWVGRLRHGRFPGDDGVVQLPVNAPPHALHGLVTDLPWTVMTSDATSVHLAVALGGDDDPWPWRCRVVQEVSLGPDRLDFRLDVESEQPMPADIGWHPWFVRELPGPGGPVAARLDVSGGRIYLHDDEDIPTGELATPPPPPWDYCFVELPAPPKVRWPGLLELTVESDCDHWVLYDMEPAGLCVEPWTGPPDSLNRADRTIVTPDRPLGATMTWTWRPVAP